MPRTLFLLRAIVVSLAVALCAPVAEAAGTTNPSKNLIPQGWPKIVSIPRIHVKAPVESITFTKVKDYSAPFQWGDVAWYDLGARPGDLGRAAIFGHLDSYTGPAVFYQLRQIKTGDTVQVSYRTGKPLNFRVQWQAIYLNSKLPMKFIFGPARERGLVLITCTGIFHRDGSGYDHKLVVYARLILPNGKLG